METDSKSSAKEGSASASKGNNAIPSSGPASLSAKAPAHPSTGPVTEEEIRAVLLESAPITTEGLVAEFWGRLKSEVDKNAFAAILRRISKKQKFDGANYLVLRAPADSSTGPGKMKSKEKRNGFAAIVRRISKIQKVDEANYVVLRDNNPSTGRVTEEEIRAFLVQSTLLATRELVTKFIGRLNSKEDKDAFVAILSKIVKAQKFDGASYLILKDK
ncbi:hypothetical protein MKW98_019861 [Papaver atlanticum]|uniref:Transcription initiation factor IIF subunit alpha n=1 Tax=Papaver atlanticum TaxID=357466 RepID=A0AAD4S1B7_9MAGN|nr:hypothetical protein MKW98_019861 [Papaver atlanticum]